MRTTINRTGRERRVAWIACALVVFACSSSKDDELAAREPCRQDVGPAGVECRHPEGVGPCTCMVDGTPTGKTVNATSYEAHEACGFPPTRSA
jgi:hypothetical protein